MASIIKIKILKSRNYKVVYALHGKYQLALPQPHRPYLIKPLLKGLGSQVSNGTRQIRVSIHHQN
jgi:hypothetical protein